MKTKFYYLLTLTVILTLSFSLSSSFVGVETAYAQLQPVNNEITDGDGGSGSSSCNGPTCDDANGHHYGDFQAGSILTCCGGSAPSSGKKSS